MLREMRSLQKVKSPKSQSKHNYQKSQKYVFGKLTFWKLTFSCSPISPEIFGHIVFGLTFLGLAISHCRDESKFLGKLALSQFSGWESSTNEVY